MPEPRKEQMMDSKGSDLPVFRGRFSENQMVIFELVRLIGQMSSLEELSLCKRWS